MITLRAFVSWKRLLFHGKRTLLDVVFAVKRYF